MLWVGIDCGHDKTCLHLLCQMISIDKSSEPDAATALLKLKQKEQVSTAAKFILYEPTLYFDINVIYFARAGNREEGSEAVQRTI